MCTHAHTRINTPDHMLPRAETQMDSPAQPQQPEEKPVRTVFDFAGASDQIEFITQALTHAQIPELDGSKIENETDDSTTDEAKRVEICAETSSEECAACLGDVIVPDEDVICTRCATPTMYKKRATLVFKSTWTSKNPANEGSMQKANHRTKSLLEDVAFESKTDDRLVFVCRSPTNSCASALVVVSSQHITQARCVR